MTPETLAAIHAASFTFPRPWTAGEFADLLASPLVVLVSGPEGFTVGRVIADEAELLTIAVLPDARRKGIGRTLLSGLVAEVEARGALRLFLEVSVENDSAIALYRGAGFARIGLRRGYFSDAGRAVDALVMQKVIRG